MFPVLFTYLWCSLPFPVSDIQICTSPLQSFCLCTFTISSYFMPVLLYCFKIHLNGTDFPRLTSFFFLQQLILQVQITTYRYPLLSDYKPKSCITVFVFFFLQEKNIFSYHLEYGKKRWQRQTACSASSCLESNCLYVTEVLFFLGWKWFMVFVCFVFRTETLKQLQDLFSIFALP